MLWRRYCCYKLPLSPLKLLLRPFLSHSSYLLIEMLFSFTKLGKVIAVRFRKNRQNDSVPVPVATPGVLSSPALPSDSSAGHVISARIERRAPVFTVGISDRVQLTLAGVQGIAGPIPLVGSPLQAAINGLLTVLQTFDVGTHLTTRTVPNLDDLQRLAQNRAVIASIRRRLHRLWRYLCNAPSAHDSAEQSRRDELIRYTPCYFGLTDTESH